MPKHCELCGKEFETSRSHAKFCSQKCKAKAWKEQKKESRRRSPKLIKHCKVCGKEFEPRSNSAKYCPDCRAEAYKEINNAAGRRFRGRKRQSKPKSKQKPLPFAITPEMNVLALRRLDGNESICMWCEKPMGDPRQHFCSDKCLLSFYAKIFNSF